MKSISIYEARQLIKDNNYDKLIVGGPTSSGKQYLLQSDFPKLEAYFRYGEEEEMPDGTKVFKASQDITTWDDPSAYKIELFLKHWQKHCQLTEGMRSPIWRRDEFGVNRVFGRKKRPNTYTVSSGYKADLFFAEVILEILTRNLLDQLFLLMVPGRGLGIDDRLVRRFLRQGSADLKKDLQILALAQIYSAPSFRKLIKLVDNYQTWYQKTCLINNPVTPQEVENHIMSINFKNQATQRNASITEYNNPNAALIGKRYWHIAANEDEGYDLVITGINHQVNFPIQDESGRNVSKETIQKLFDMIINYKQYSVEDVMSL